MPSADTPKMLCAFEWEIPRFSVFGKRRDDPLMIDADWVRNRPAWGGPDLSVLPVAEGEKYE